MCFTSVENSEGKVCGGQAKLMLLYAKGFRVEGVVVQKKVYVCDGASSRVAKTRGYTTRVRARGEQPP